MGFQQSQWEPQLSELWWWDLLWLVQSWWGPPMGFRGSLWELQLWENQWWDSPWLDWPRGFRASLWEHPWWECPWRRRSQSRQ